MAIGREIGAHFAAEFGKPFEGFTDEAERDLLDHDWPGNVRELRNVLERAMIFAKTPALGSSDLILLKTEPADDASSEGYYRFRTGGSLEDLEHGYIRHVLQEYDTSYAEVARMLGISKKTLWEKRKKFSLDEPAAEASKSPT